MDNTKPPDAFTAPPLSQFLSAHARRVIAECLGHAMHGRNGDALSTLEALSEPSSSPDAVACAITRAHILHLDREPEAALRVLDRDVFPNLYELPESVRIIAEQNRIEVVVSCEPGLADDIQRHYRQVDRRRLLGIQLRDSDSLVEAAQASADGKSYDSLPLYSEGLFKSYRQFNWRGIREYSNYLCRELLRVGEPVEAVFYAVLADDKNAAKAVADLLRARNDATTVENVLFKLREVSHLRRHLTCACHVLVALGDAVPDSEVGFWLDRLRADRALSGENLQDSWASNPAWTASTALVAGASAPIADAIVDEILNHPRWMANDIARLGLYEPLEAAADVATVECCLRILDAVVPHAIASEPGHDLRKAFSVLMTLAQRSAELKKAVAQKVFRGQKRLPYLLLTVAGQFSPELRVENANKMALTATDHLQWQVERLAPGESPKTGFGEYVIENRPTKEGAVAVKIGSCNEELQALAYHAKGVDPAVLNRLVETILNVMRDPENSSTNRIMLLNVLGRLAESLNDEAVAQVADVVTTFAEDHRVAAHPLFGQPQQHSPLNAFRMGGSWPQEVRGEALAVLARVSIHHPELTNSRLNRVLRSGMSDVDPAVRRAAYRAVALASSHAVDCLPLVVGGTRDSDPEAANIALQVVGVHATTILQSDLLPAVLTPIEMQLRNPDVLVRHAVAIVVRQLRDASAELVGDEKQRLVAIADQLARDVSRGVRRALATSSA